VKRGPELLRQIETARCAAPAIWWLGGSGFALKFKQAIVYVDPCLAAPGAPFPPEAVTHAGLILCTHRARLDGAVLPAMLAASPRAKLVIPKSLGAPAHQLGIDYSRMVTTDSGLRVEYLDDRVYAVPSACEQLDWTPLGGYPHLGFLVRFGGVTIYHAGAGVPYDDLEARLRPYNVTVALLPVSGRPGNFEIAEAAQLAENIGARWAVPFAPTQPPIERFIEHMLGHRPAQAFKVFEPGEMWTIPG
jgi:L-ascorbate metabolism protein UlaG (beta-lactamase superfamily)